MNKHIEIISTSGFAKVIVQPTECGATAWYYRQLPSGTDWVLDRVTQMKTPFENAVALATKIVDAPPRPKR